MSNHKASLYALVLIALTACSKELSPIPENTEKQPPSQQLIPEEEEAPQPKTRFGLMTSLTSTSETEAQLDKAHVRIVRAPLFLSQTIIGKTIDEYIADGYRVQVNLN